MKLAATALSVLCTLALPLAAADVGGRWILEIPEPGVVELDQLQLELTVEGTRVSGVLITSNGAIEGAGSWDPQARRLSFAVQIAPDAPGALHAELREGRLVGTFELLGSVVPIDASPAGANDDQRAPPIAIDFSVEAPVTVSLAGLPDELAIAVMEAIERLVRTEHTVGLSAAIATDGVLTDVRSFGWEDFPARVPASGRTMYRWASISKPLTAVAVLQLYEQGALELDVDARRYVPEFPAKAHAFTARQLLCHQAGIVHYRRMGIRTLREYDLEHPWTDPIVALDMFNERELLFEPGARYHYTTPGFVLLGAVVERAGEGSYVEQVTARICKPLGMSSMRPDRDWIDIPHRARGYVRSGAGTVIDSGTDNICWKLAAGGWISTVGDLARFGCGLMGAGELLGLETQIAMWTEQRTSSGEATGYGLGIGVGELAGRGVVSHGGAQRKTATYLLVCPEEQIAVALMCNTQGTSLGGLARELMGLLLAAGSQ